MYLCFNGTEETYEKLPLSSHYESKLTILAAHPPIPSTTTLSYLLQCQTAVSNLLKDKVLVGHALKNDLDVLMLSHPRAMIRDTATYRPYMRVSVRVHVIYLVNNLHHQIMTTRYISVHKSTLTRMY